MPIDDNDEGCTIEVIEEDDDEDNLESQGGSSTSDVKPNIVLPQEPKPDLNVTPPITITKIETLAEEIGKVTENKLSAPVNDEVPLTKLVDEDLIDAIIEDKKGFLKYLCIKSHSRALSGVLRRVRNHKSYVDAQKFF